MTQDIATRLINERAKNMGFYNEADIMRVQNEIADSIILDNLPVGIAMPVFNSYLDKINYIISCNYTI